MKNVKNVNRVGDQVYPITMLAYGDPGSMTQISRRTPLPIEDHQELIRRGLVAGVTGWNKFGYRTGLTAAGGEQTIWAAEGNFTPMQAAGAFTVSYNPVTDGVGTTGATQVYFYYLTADGIPAIMPHTLGSTGSDTTSFTGLGINRCVVAANGGATYNVSDITVFSNGSPGEIQAFIPATQSVTQQGIFFTGTGYTAIARFLDLSVDVATKTAVILIKGYVYNRQFDTRFEIFRTVIDTAVELRASLTDPIGFVLNSTDVLYFVADSDSNSVDIHLRFSLNMYAN